MQNILEKAMTDIQTVNKKSAGEVRAANAFAAAGSELTGSALPILKLSKSGAWVFGAENTPLTETRLAADVQGAQRGFICFVDGEVVEDVMEPVALGKAITPDDLADHGPYADGDGWVTSASIQLRSIETGEEYMFKPTSHGGRAAIGALLTKYGYRLSAKKGGIPIVECDVTSYEHKRYGTVFKPVFNIVSWQDEAELMVKDDDTKLGEELLDELAPF